MLIYLPSKNSHYFQSDFSALAIGLFHIPVSKLKADLMIYKMGNIFGMDELINYDQVKHSNYLG